MQTCDFRIVIQGAADDRKSLAGLMRTLPQDNSPGNLQPAVLLETVLNGVQEADDSRRQT